MNPARDWLFAAKLTFDIIIVIEFFLGQIESVCVSLFRPASLFIGAAFRTSFGMARNLCTAVRTDFGRHITPAFMQSSKFQAPSSRETPNPKLQLPQCG